MASRVSGPGWPEELSRNIIEGARLEAWLAALVVQRFSSRTKVRSSAAAVTATMVPCATDGWIVASVLPLTVACTTA